MSITVAVNGVNVFTLTDDQLNMLHFSMSSESVSSNITNWLVSMLNSKLSAYQNALSDLWLPQIKKRYQSIPSNDSDVSKLIYSQPDYKSYDQRHAKPKTEPEAQQAK